jgi:import inner membrane translocase subunit TIM23
MDERQFEHLQRPASLFDDEPDYLEYDFRGRPYHEKLFFNSGVAYTVGSIGGMVFGGLRGLSQAPSSKMRVKMNGLFNGAGKYGSRAGNAMGVLALFYTSTEKGIDMLGADELTGGVIPYCNQIGAGFSTGVLYKCMSRPTTALLAGVIGGAAMGAMSHAEYAYNTGRLF